MALPGGRGGRVRRQRVGAGTAAAIPDRDHPSRHRTVQLSAGLPNTLGQDRDQGDGEDVAESLRAARVSGLDPAHPDASGGRAMVLFGPDGVLLVDTQNRQVADKTLQAIRSFTDAPIKVLVNTHMHSDHTGANAFFAKQGALIFAQDNLRDEMLRPPTRANGQPAPRPTRRRPGVDLSATTPPHRASRR